MQGALRLLVGCSILACSLTAFSAPNEYFKITVVDAQTNRGVPLIELKTVNGIRMFTDSRGVVAFHEPGLMGKRVFFHVSGHGYEFAKDGFGFRGRALLVRPGESATLKIKRLNIAERLYRVTGAGIYRDSVLVGEADQAPTAQPVLNAEVFGSDSVVNAIYRGKLYWFWGDTNRPSYPLGNFHVPGAWSLLPKEGGLDPSIGVNLNYFRDERTFAKETAKMPGPGPTWINGLVTLKNKEGKEQLLGHYVKVKPPLKVYQHGLIVFDDAKSEFRKLKELPEDAPCYPNGHPFLHSVAGVRYVYFGGGFPLVRVPATAEAFQQLENFETFTCLVEGSTLDDPKIDRDAEGRVRYAWRRRTPALNMNQEQKLIRNKLLVAGEGLLPLRDVESGKRVLVHRGSVAWNPYRKRWGMIALQQFGSSLLGEVWFSEADTPVGPWVYACKVASHERYSFYNPRQHEYFAQQDGRLIYFEGTYTNMFSGNPDQTPRYNYNQVMYRLDLGDPRVALPSPIYRCADAATADALADQTGRKGRKIRDIAFFALDRKTAATRPLFVEKGRLTTKSSSDERKPLCFVPVAKDSPADTTPLYEFHNRERDVFVYSVDVEWSGEGYQRADEPVCRVWKSPYLRGLWRNLDE